MSVFLDRMLEDISLDKRIEDGIFNLENDIHMQVMREYLVNKGISENEVVDFSNSVLEGKYPQRQAYNSNGLLVTFPTPEYKQRAIQRGTHFEKNPKVAQSNLFVDPNNNQQQSTSPESPSATPPSTEPEQKPNTTNLPMSGVGAKSSKDIQATTNVAPQASPSSSEDKSEPTEPTELPPPEIKPPKEKEADKKVIHKIISGDDYMLEYGHDTDDKIIFNREAFRNKYTLLKMYIDNIYKLLSSNPNESIKNIEKFVVELKAIIDSFRL
jgi:hypothetical protein